MKRICWFLFCLSLTGMEEVHVKIPAAKSSKDLLAEDNIKRAISNYFKENPDILYPHIVEPLKRKIEESSSEQLDGTLEHARNSIDLERLTQSLITDLLKEALEHKKNYDSGEEGHKDKNKAKYALYTALAGGITTVTGILATYFLSSSS